MALFQPDSLDFIETINLVEREYNRLSRKITRIENYGSHMNLALRYWDLIEQLEGNLTIF